MSDKLQDIEKQIAQAEKNRDNMTAEQTGLTARIARLTAEQESLILAGKDAAKIETDLLAAQIRERGLTKVIATLSETIAQLQAERAAEKHARIVTQAQGVKAVSLGLVREAMNQLDDCLLTLRTLENKNFEYGQFLNRVGTNLRDPQIDNMAGLINSYRAAIGRLQAQFPADAFSTNQPPYQV